MQQGMVIQLYIVGERVMFMKPEVKPASKREFLVDIHITMQIFWDIKKHCLMRRQCFWIHCV